MNYIYTVYKSRSEEDAIDFLNGILELEHSIQINEFKRTLVQTPTEINIRLQHMSIHSPSEYAYMGRDGKTGLAIYTFWGVI